MIRSLAQGETLPQGSVLLGELRDVGSEVIYCLLVDCLLDLEAVDIFDLVGEVLWVLAIDGASNSTCSPQHLQHGS